MRNAKGHIDLKRSPRKSLRRSPRVKKKVCIAEEDIDLILAEVNKEREDRQKEAGSFRANLFKNLALDLELDSFLPSFKLLSYNDDSSDNDSLEFINKECLTLFPFLYEMKRSVAVPP